MGKILIIKGADFSLNAIERVDPGPGPGPGPTPTVRTALFGLSDSQLGQGTSLWTIGAESYGIANQAILQGHTIVAIKMNVSTPGVVSLYKAASPNPSSVSEMTLVATATATSVGVQEIELSSSVSISEGEYLLIGTPGGTSQTLVGKYSAKTQSIPRPQGFYYKAGTSEVTSDGLGYGNTQSLDMDFITEDEVIRLNRESDLLGQITYDKFLRVTSPKGAETSLAGYRISDFVDVQGKTHFAVLTSPRHCAVFYDSEKQVLGYAEVYGTNQQDGNIWIPASTNNDLKRTWRVVSMPEGTKYVRFNFTSDSQSDFVGEEWEWMLW